MSYHLAYRHGHIKSWCVCPLNTADSNYLECSHDTGYVYDVKLCVQTKINIIRKKHINQPTGFGAYYSCSYSSCNQATMGTISTGSLRQHDFFAK